MAPTYHKKRFNIDTCIMRDILNINIKIKFILLKNGTISSHTIYFAIFSPFSKHHTFSRVVKNLNITPFDRSLHTQIIPLLETMDLNSLTKYN